MSRIFFKRVYVCLMLSMCLVCAMQIFAQEPSLAEQIFQKYQALLQREDVQEALPTVLIELKKPEHQQFLKSATINAVLDTPDTLKTLIPDTSDDFITLLKEAQRPRPTQSGKFLSLPFCLFLLFFLLTIFAKFVMILQ